MEIKGKILQIWEVKQISEKFKLQPILIETGDKYPRKLQLQLKDRAMQQIINIGDVLVFKFDAESREYNDKWYTNLNCYEITR
jgi:hypothetical protein